MFLQLTRIKKLLHRREANCVKISPKRLYKYVDDQFKCLSMSPYYLFILYNFPLIILRVIIYRSDCYVNKKKLNLIS